MLVIPRRRRAVGLLVPAALALAAFAYGVRTPAALPGGPFGDYGDGANLVAMPADVGEPVSLGAMPLRNRGDVPVEIRAVELVGQEPAVRFVGALVSRGPAGIGGVPGFPPEPDRHRRPRFEPAVGARPEPGEFVELVVTEPGAHGFDDVAVRYRARGLPYGIAMGLGGRVCAPATRRGWPVDGDDV